MILRTLEQAISHLQMLINYLRWLLRCDCVFDFLIWIEHKSLLVCWLCWLRKRQNTETIINHTIAYMTHRSRLLKANWMDRLHYKIIKGHVFIQIYNNLIDKRWQWNAFLNTSTKSILSKASWSSPTITITVKRANNNNIKNASESYLCRLDVVYARFRFKATHEARTSMP